MRICLCILLLSFGWPANAALNPSVYFVSPTGSPSNDGLTILTPLSQDFALQNAVSNTTLMFMSGNYTSIVIRAAGVTVKSLSRWGAHVVGVTNQHGIATTGTLGNMTVDGFHVDHSFIDGIKCNGDNCIVRNCWVHDAGKGAPNWAYNTNQTFTGQGIASHNHTNNLIENNLIENNGVWIRFDHGVYLNGTNCIVRNNVIRNNLSWGIQVYHDTPSDNMNIQVYNNLIYSNVVSGCVTVWSWAGLTNFVYGNTLICTTNHSLISDWGHVVAHNNILFSGSLYATVELKDGGTADLGNNLVNKAAVLPDPSGPGDVVATDFLPTDASRGQFWPSASSPARGMADGTITAVPVDFWGRSVGGPVDVGAFQYSSILAADKRDFAQVGAYWGTNSFEGVHFEAASVGIPASSPSAVPSIVTNDGQQIVSNSGSTLTTN